MELKKEQDKMIFISCLRQVDNRLLDYANRLSEANKVFDWSYAHEDINKICIDFIRIWKDDCSFEIFNSLLNITKAVLVSQINHTVDNIEAGISVQYKNLLIVELVKLHKLVVDVNVNTNVEGK